MRFWNPSRIFAMALCLVSLPLTGFSIPAFGEEESAEPGFESVWGISIQPKAFWFGKMLGADEVADNPIKYRMEPHSFTSYEGGFWDDRSGWRLGVSAGMDDNLVGDLYDFMISAGYKGVLLRLQTGAISGHVEWEGKVTSQTPRRLGFESKYTNIDLLWDWGLAAPGDIKSATYGMYLGLGYTSLKLPILVRWADDRWVIKGVDLYQEETEVTVYSLVFGQENMSPAFLYRPTGLTGWYQYQVRLGYFGEAKLRRRILDLMSEVNPDMTQAPETIPLFFSDFEFILGAQHTGQRGELKYALGLGYSLMGSMFTGDGGGLGFGSSGGDNTLYTGFSLWRHGPVIKAMARW